MIDDTQDILSYHVFLHWNRRPRAWRVGLLKVQLLFRQEANSPRGRGAFLAPLQLVCATNQWPIDGAVSPIVRKGKSWEWKSPVTTALLIILLQHIHLITGASSGRSGLEVKVPLAPGGRLQCCCLLNEGSTHTPHLPLISLLSHRKNNYNK
jgi:hypothetical protein